MTLWVRLTCVSHVQSNRSDRVQTSGTTNTLQRPEGEIQPLFIRSPTVVVTSPPPPSIFLLRPISKEKGAPTERELGFVRLGPVAALAWTPTHERNPCWPASSRHTALKLSQAHSGSHLEVSPAPRACPRATQPPCCPQLKAAASPRCPRAYIVLMLPFLEVEHLPSSSSFYSAILQPLGLHFLFTEDGHFPSSSYGTSSQASPVLRLQQVVASRDRPLKPSRIVLSAPSAASTDQAYEFALRANPDARGTHPRHFPEGYTSASGASAHRARTSGGGTRAYN